MRHHRLLIATSLTAVLRWPAAGFAQEPYSVVSGKARIASSIQLSLAPAKRGLSLVQTGIFAEDFDPASDAIYTSYRHLRMAKETSEKPLGESKCPDSLTQLRDPRIQKIRDGLQFCRDSDGAPIKQDSEFIRKTLRRLVAAVQLLEIDVATDN